MRKIFRAGILAVALIFLVSVALAGSLGVIEPKEPANGDKVVFSVNVISGDVTPPASITHLTNRSYAPTYINWTWTDPKDADFSKVMIYIDGKFKTNVTKGKRYYNATGFLPNTTHRISTRTVDTSGNINNTWVNHTARTKPDAIPPKSITNLTNESYDSSYIIWIWKDPPDYDFSKVMVYINGKFKTNITKGTKYYIATNLTKDTLYTISTHTVDTSGNVNKTWRNHSARTAKYNTPPASITNLKNMSYACTYINWTWSDPKNPDFLKVMVYIDGKFKTNVSKGVRYYKATGLFPNTSHKISTHTIDNLGSINQTWRNHSARTAPCKLSTLIINDDNDIYFGDDKSVAVVKSAFEKIGYNVTIEKANKTSNSTWNKYNITVWSSGDDYSAINNTEYKEMLIDYVDKGGHLIIESGNAAFWLNKIGYKPIFREKVLHITSDWVFNDVGNLTLAKQHPVATTPNDLTDIIGFTPTNPGDYSGDADGVRVLNATGVYNWSYVAYEGEKLNITTSGLIAYDNDADVNNGGQIIYYAFDIDDIDSSDIQRKLIENSERWLR